VIGDVATEVPRLRDQHDLLVMGSGRLVQALREHDLVDEYEIWIHPILLGAGKRLFEDVAGTATLSLRGTKTTDRGRGRLSSLAEKGAANSRVRQCECPIGIHTVATAMPPTASRPGQDHEEISDE
jgi:dihydrofolate reductase